jgi:hypothetical protein
LSFRKYLNNWRKFEKRLAGRLTTTVQPGV